MYKQLGVALLALGAFASCGETADGFGRGWAQAQHDLAAGDYELLDYYGRPGNVRADNRLGLLVPGCEAPRARLFDIIEGGARTGEEMVAALESQLNKPPILRNFVHGDEFWSKGSVPALVECYAEDDSGAPVACSWLLLSRNAPAATYSYVSGYNSRKLQELADETVCASIPFSVNRDRTNED